MLKILYYTVVLALLGLAFYYFGSSVALALMGLFFVFIIMIYYLKSHTIEIEEHNYAKDSLNIKTTNFVKSSKQTELPPVKKELIPADPNVIEAFKRALAEKNSTRSEDSTIGILKSRQHIPIKARDASKNTALAFAKQSSSKSEAGEKLKVTISQNAKKLQKKSPPKIFNSTPTDLEKSNDFLGLEKNLATINSIVNKYDSDPPTSEQASDELEIFNNQSIFDTLIDEDDDRIFAKITYKYSKDTINPQINNLPDTNSELKTTAMKLGHSEASKSIKDSAETLKSEAMPKVKISQIRNELATPENEDLTELQELSQTKAFAEIWERGNALLAENKPSLGNKTRTEILFLIAKSAIELGYFEDARIKFLEYFDSQLVKENEEIFKQKICDVATDFAIRSAQKFAIPFLITALSLHREDKEFKEMDALYSQIVLAYRQLNQNDKIIEVYQNQLAIKRNLQDFEGQLEILDKLGKIYYDMRNVAESSFCYQQTIEIRKQMLNKDQAI